MIGIESRVMMIDFKNVSKIYKTKKGVETRALNNVNLKIGNKGMVFIVGKSGSGKSTMLNLLGGLDTVSSGELLINCKNISKFKNKQYDAYRNTYIGFIFQEFNILEQYNVYENIELALRLQNKKETKENIDILLKKIGLEGLGQRKINELSGGQKQRVAIARALIKNPKIILADEPTGNLDQISSKQIFDLLKEISKEKLVIIVSHDMESACKYADRMIEISDGNIIKDTNPINEIEKEEFRLKKAKLPFLYSLKMAMKSLRVKPFKLLMTTILTAMALIFMGFTINCLIFDKEAFITNTMNNNNKYAYSLNKIKFLGIEGSKRLSLTDHDIKKIKNMTDSIINEGYQLYDNEVILNFEFGDKNVANKPDYYESIPMVTTYVELKDDKLPGTIIGTLPSNDRQLVIHKYLAEYMIKYGVIDSNNQIYQPKTIEELIHSNHQLKLGDNDVVISGVVDDDNHIFESYKEGKPFENDTIEQYYSFTYTSLSSIIYVNGFTKIAKLNTNKELVLDKMLLTTIDKNPDLQQFSDKLKSLKEEIAVITKDGIKHIQFLNKGEVILSIDDIQEFDQKYKSELETYLKQHSNISYSQAVQEFTQGYMKNNILFYNRGLKLRVPNIENGDIEYVPVTIIGISIGDFSYISNQYIEEYTPLTKERISAYIYDNDLDHLKGTFKKLKYSDINESDMGTFYIYQIVGLNEIDIHNIIAIYKGLYKYLLIISLIFVLFAFLLFSNFIGVSISYCKKEIGILRALGARSNDTLKIFTYESLIIGFVSWVLAVIGWNYLCDILNQSMFGNAYYPLNGIIKSPFVPLGMLIFTVIISFIITFISINRVNRIKPIDAILNK